MQGGNIMSLGEKIKEYRKKKNMTQKELANLIGAKHNSISDWENNKNKPDADTIERLCEVLEMIPNDFFGNYSREESGTLVGRIMKDQKIINMISCYYSLDESDKKAIKHLIESLSKKGKQ